jgi:hypothetical protein
MQMGDVEVYEDDDEWEPVETITSPCKSVSGYWGLSAKKPVQIGDPLPIPRGAGLGSLPTPVTGYGNGQSHNNHNGTSGQPNVLLEISYFTGELQYVIFYNIILGLGRQLIAIWFQEIQYVHIYALTHITSKHNTVLSSATIL